MDKRTIFYRQTISKQISDKTANVLVVGGSTFDRDMFLKEGFVNVTITGLDLDVTSEAILPFSWQRENATSLSFKNDSFDYVVAHACIHHASRPHQMLLEMYRVASKGVLAFESRDSLLIRMLAKINLTQTYEHAAVHFNDSKCGGVDNTEIPNYVYRWTEREIEKTIQSFSPICENEYIYTYGSSSPCTPELESAAAIKKFLIFSVTPFYKIFTIMFKKQQNLFAFYIGKGKSKDKIFPWLIYDKVKNKISYNQEWSNKKYKNYQ